MSKYTMELRFVIQSGFDLGLQDYPIFDEAFRERLNQKIINHYLFHEIGFETVERFKHFLNTTMNEEMPYFNQLYESELLKYNPLLSFKKSSFNTKSTSLESEQNLNNTSSIDNTTISSTDETQDTTSNENATLESDGTKSSASNSVQGDMEVFSDTPQSTLGDVFSGAYATTATKKDSDNTANTHDELKNTDTSIKDGVSKTTIDSDSSITNNTDTSSDTINKNASNTMESFNAGDEGFSVSVSELMMKHRETFLNIDKMVIESLSDLFMKIY